ncbi:MAG: hemolysin family protein [Egibacteraceae bacterium]
MNPGDVYALAGVLACVLLAAFFAAAQTAYSRMTLTRALKLAEDGRRSAQRVVRLVQDPTRTLNVLALLVVAVQVTGVAVLTVVVARYLDDAPGAAVASVVGAAAMFVGAEVAPKTLALQRTETVARVTSGWVARLVKVLSPLVSALIWMGNVIAPGKGLAQGPFVTEDDLREMIDTAESDEVIEETERAMIHSIFELSDTVVREIMVPRPDMVAVAVGIPLGEVLDVILERGHSRIPVYREDRDRIVGLVYAKDVLGRMRAGDGALAGPWDDLLRTPFFVPELKPVDALLRELQAAKVHLAIVVDEYGATAGLVTIEDILEEIVGEIVDEYDAEEELVEQVPDHALRVDARLPISDLAALLDAELPSDEWDTVGGLLFGVLGHVPDPGEHVDVSGVRLTAELVRGRRIAKVLVDRLDEERVVESAGDRV